ncbi:MAG TPA: hypothetical protein PKH03_05015 [Syntrophales bacterium]|nr:hypothetical protein [Syntrophales bacterium]
MDKQKNREANQIAAEFNDRHRDVLEPLIGRINELSAAGDGDGIYLLHEALQTVCGAIRDLLRSRPIVTEDQIAKAGGDPKKALN